MLILALNLINPLAYAVAKKKAMTAEQLIVADEWPGAADFLSVLRKERREPCQYLKAAEVKYAGVEFVIRRVLMISEFTECSERVMLVQKYINHKDPLLAAAAIRVAARLPAKSREQFNAKVIRIKEAPEHSVLLDAAETYPLDSSSSPPEKE